MARYTYECERGHITEIYKGINDPKPWKCIEIITCENDPPETLSQICGASLEWVPEPVAFQIK